jgi:adenosylcobinamide-GDP ribazoletransferase
MILPSRSPAPDRLRFLWRLLGAITFYTCLPIPHTWRLDFEGIARWAPAVGLGIGGLLGLMDAGLQALGMPVLVRSALVVVGWVGVTGGLHLDGAMDTADGLAVEPSRRLQVMADSHSGAFGVMAAIALVLLKTVALAALPAALPTDRGLALMLAAGWGRWGQLVAIVRYPYLKPEGKGALHKRAVRSAWDLVPSLVLLLSIAGLYLSQSRSLGARAIMATGGALAIAIGTGLWFHRRLGGQTGDTYGAIVEWTEALLLCGLTLP